MKHIKENILKWFSDCTELGPGDKPYDTETERELINLGNWLREYLDSCGPNITQGHFREIWAKSLSIMSSGDVGADWDWFQSTWLGISTNNMDKIEDFYGGDYSAFSTSPNPLVEHLGPQHIQQLGVNSFVVVTEDFQWEFIPEDQVVAIEENQEDWTVVWEPKPGEKHEITGMVKYLALTNRPHKN